MIQFNPDLFSKMRDSDIFHGSWVNLILINLLTDHNHLIIYYKYNSARSSFFSKMRDSDIFHGSCVNLIKINNFSGIILNVYILSMIQLDLDLFLNCGIPIFFAGAGLI